MYLAKLHLERFRACVNTHIKFSPLVTVVVGENGSGKSAVVDAIRLSVAPASGKRFYYWQEDRDLSFSSPTGARIQIQQIYQDLSDYEKSAYIEKLTDNTDDLTYTATFDTRSDLPYNRRIARFVGSAKVPDPDLFSVQRIGCVYLPPLRDAAREFDSGDGTRLSEVMMRLAQDGESEEFLAVGNAAMESMADSKLVKRTVESIQNHLSRVTHPTRKQEVNVGYRHQDIRRLSRYLRLQMAEVGYDPGDLTSSGLGYANLLYIASVVLELESSAERDLTLVLVEEPEAHLHPQLQMVLLDYLRAKASASAEHTPIDRPAGRIQVIVTTHSPNIASAVSTSEIVVVTTTNVSAPLPSTGSRNTKCISLSERGVSESERRKLDRYLTVTRSSLLFARRVILVEGLSESVLLQQIADKCVLKAKRHPEERPDTVERWREAFAAVSIIAIDSVDFGPYLKLLVGGSDQLVDRLVVITDNDNGAGIRRRKKYMEDFPSAATSQVLTVQVGDATLEADILAHSANEQVMEKCYLRQHPSSREKWSRILSAAPVPHVERAGYIANSMNADLGRNRLEFGKGEFSQLLIEELGDPQMADDFWVPEYLRNGILDVVR